MEQIKGTDLTEVIKTVAQMTEERMKAQVKPEIVEIYGTPHYRDLHGDMVPVGKPEPDAGVMPQTFQTFTLQGLVDWIKADVDKLFTQDKPAALVSVTCGCMARSKERRGGGPRWRTAPTARLVSPSIPLWTLKRWQLPCMRPLSRTRPGTRCWA